MNGRTTTVKDIIAAVCERTGKEERDFDNLQQMLSRPILTPAYYGPRPGKERSKKCGNAHSQS